MVKKLFSTTILLFILLLVLALSACVNSEEPPVNNHIHEFGEWSVIESATCTAPGEEVRVCTCGDKETETIEMLEHPYKNGICTVCGQNALDMGYTHAVPESQGVANVIERAYLLSDVEWTPIADVPGLAGSGKLIIFEAGVTYKGIPYSGVTDNDFYVGLNVSLESFLTALKNPNSVLYTENLQSTNSKAATYFGTVCSKFAQYALDVPGSYNTSNIPNIPGMRIIGFKGLYKVDAIKLGDVVVNTKQHTTICTDILYDENGKVAFIEIAEATYPTVRRKLWSPDEFYEHFSNYALYRYDYIDDAAKASVPGLCDQYDLMPRLGDKFNYKLSSTPAVVDILSDGYYKAVIVRDGISVCEVILNGESSFTFDRSVPGYIEMYLEKEDGTRSKSVYACVVSSEVSVTDTANYKDGKLTVSFDGSAGVPLYVQVGSAHAVFCNIEGEENAAELTFILSRVSSNEVRVAYQNEYGVYLSSWVSFTVSPDTSEEP